MRQTADSVRLKPCKACLSLDGQPVTERPHAHLRKAAGEPRQVTSLVFAHSYACSACGTTFERRLIRGAVGHRDTWTLLAPAVKTA